MPSNLRSYSQPGPSERSSVSVAAIGSSQSGMVRSATVYYAGNSDTLTFVISMAYVYVEGRGMTAQTKSDLPQGTLDLLVLQIVALEPLHGYAIAQRLRQMSRDVVQVTQGTLYPALHRLENRGLLAADWKASDTGRDAKFYKLTRKGRAHLEAEAASWERLTGAVAAILNTAKGEAS